MSFKVLVIPEDPTNNGYILKPLVEAILDDVGKPNAKVQVLTNPHLEGYEQAVKAIREELPDRYGFWDLWLFFPDADLGTQHAMDNLEQEIGQKGIKLLCCPACPEVEIYPCASKKKELGISWEAARNHPSLKEQIFWPLLKRFGDTRRAGGGRDLLIQESLANLQLLYELCVELKVLRDRLIGVLPH